MALVFASQKKPRAQDRASLRRQKILAGIDNQITLAGLARQGTAPKKAWFWQGDDGRYFLSIRYGRSEIELAKGIYSVECADLDALGSRLIDRQSQNRTVAAKATAERKTFGHLS